VTRVSVIKAEYGPTLPQLLAGRSLALRAGAVALAGLIVVAAALVAITSRAGETAVLIRTPLTFNLMYGDQWQRVERPGTLLALRNTSRAGLFLDSYTVRDLRLPAYRGVVGGMLPIYANGYLRGIRKRYKGFEFVSEGRARINNAIGYEVTFQARSGARRLYGRHYLLVDEAPDGQRHGVVIELVSTPAAGTPSADEIGGHGALKTPLRSFRFGEDREGGTS
jgi:hypothetical protein